MRQVRHRSWSLRSAGRAAALAPLLAVALGVGGGGTGAAASVEPVAEWEILEQRAADGEQCLVCRKALHGGEVVEVRYRGRTFHVATSMLDEFVADPDRYFNTMEAHAALFDERAFDAPPTSNAWLYFGIWVLAGLVFGAASAYVAIDRGLPAVGWFFAGFLVNVLALAAVVSRTPRRPMAGEERRSGLTKVSSTHTPRPCPACGASNHPAAAACSACGAPLEAAFEAETARV